MSVRSRSDRNRIRSSVPIAVPSARSASRPMVSTASGAPAAASASSSSSAIAARGAGAPVRAAPPQDRRRRWVAAAGALERELPLRADASPRSRSRARAPRSSAASSAAPSASSAARSRKSSSDVVRSGSIRARIVLPDASNRHGCMLPPDGAVLAHATMKRSSAGVGAPSPGGGTRRADPARAGGGRRQRRERRLAALGVSASRSAWKRPEAVSSPSAIRRTALATIAPPSATSDASCGHVETDSLTSTIDAAARCVRPAGSRIRITNGTFCLVVSPASSADVTSPSRPWNGGRPGSRSKRSMSSIPRWLVAITTGREAARACSRSSSLISSPSHSSTTTSAPATNSATVSSSTPRGNSDHVDVRVELGDLARGQHDLADPDVGEAAGHAVEVREVEHVEVGKAQLAADPLVRQRRHHRAADRQARDGDRERRSAAPALRA